MNVHLKKKIPKKNLNKNNDFLVSFLPSALFSFCSDGDIVPFSVPSATNDLSLLLSLIGERDGTARC